MGILIVFLWFVASVVAQTNPCVLTGPNGEIVDLTGMYLPPSAGDYRGNDLSTTTPYTYVMNVCGVCNYGGPCTASNASLCQFDSNGYVNSLVSVTASPLPQWQFLNPANASNGVELLAANGDICFETNVPRTVTIAILCDANAPINGRFFVYESTNNLCDYHVNFSHPNACPLPSSGIGPLTDGVSVTGSVAQGAWVYFSIYVPIAYGELKVSVVDSSTNGWLALYVRRGALPTTQATDYVDSTYGTQYHGLEIRKTSPTPLAPENTYYVGLLAQGTAVQSFTLTAWTYFCPNDCSGHGTCNAKVNLCSCDPGYETDQPDCSAPETQIVQGEFYSGSVRGARMAYYSLNVVDPQASQLFVQLYRSDPNSLALPTLMVGRNRYPSISSNDGIISDYGNPPAQLLVLEVDRINDATWTIGVLGSADYIFNFTVTARVCDCPKCCSDRGNCTNGLCQCPSGFQGSVDCSVATSALYPTVSFNWNLAAGAVEKFYVDIPYEVAASRTDMIVTATQNVFGGGQIQLFAGDDLIPSSTKYTYASPKPLTNRAQVVVPSASIDEDNEQWFFALYNFAASSATGSILLYYNGWCSCEGGHGSCNINLTGSVCTCDAGWEGSACDVVAPSSSGSDAGTVAGVVIALFFVAVGVGVLVKSFRPDKPSATINYA